MHSIAIGTGPPIIMIPNKTRMSPAGRLSDDITSSQQRTLRNDRRQNTDGLADITYGPVLHWLAGWVVAGTEVTVTVVVGTCAAARTAREEKRANCFKFIDFGRVIRKQAKMQDERLLTRTNGCFIAATGNAFPELHTARISRTKRLGGIVVKPGQERQGVCYTIYNQ
jgi:hypothetical protein